VAVFHQVTSDEAVLCESPVSTSRTAKRAKLRFLVAPGAGAPCSSEWMQEWSKHLRRLGEVRCFDYPYQLAGRRAPDPLPKLILAHRAALEQMRADAEGDVILVGKSMGGRVGCHLAVELGQAAPRAVVCLGYPLIGGGRMRDEVLVALRTPALFVQGTRDPMCPLDELERVRKRMTITSQLFPVEAGDHSLRVTAASLRASGSTQAEVFEDVVNAIATFLEALSPQ
jgi:uncharacterized protein